MHVCRVLTNILATNSNVFASGLLNDLSTKDFVVHYTSELKNFSSHPLRIPFRVELLDLIVNIVSCTKGDDKKRFI